MSSVRIQRLMLCFFLTYLLAIPLHTQPNDMDSLLKQLDREQSDSQRVWIHFRLASAYDRVEQHDSARQACRDAVALAAATGNRQLLGMAMKRTAEHFRTISFTDSMAYYAQQAINLFEQDQLLIDAASAYLDLGHVLQMKGALSKANEIFIKAATLNSQADADSLNDRVFINIATTFTNLQDTLREYQYLSKALKIADRYQHPRNQIIARMGISSSLRKLDQPDSADIFLEEARLLANEYQEPMLTAYIFLNQASSKSLAGDEKGALEHHRKAMGVQGVPPFDRARFKYFYARKLLQINDLRKAEVQASQLLKSAQKLGAKDLELDAHDLLMEIFEKLGDFKRGLHHAKRFALLNDSIFNAEAQSEIRKLTLQADHNRQSRENLALRAENAEAKLALVTAQNRARHRLLIALICIASLIGALVSFFYYKKDTDAQKNILNKTNQINSLQILQLKNEQEQIALKSMIRGEELERRRIARDLHDGLGGLLSTIKISLGSFQEQLGNAHKQQLKTVFKLADRANSELRQIAHNLVPESLVKFGFITAIEDLVADINYNTNLKAEFQTIHITEAQIKTDKLQLYRIIQELLNNVIKHASTSSVFLQILEREDHIIIVVEDDGIGFDGVGNKTGIGLDNIKTRMSYLNGSVNIDSQPGRGVSTSLSIPNHND